MVEVTARLPVAPEPTKATVAHAPPRVAAVREHADVLRLQTQVLVAALAHLAGAAAHPRIDEAHVADLHALRVGPERDHLADILVAHGERQLDAAVGQHHLLAATDLV